MAGKAGTETDEPANGADAGHAPERVKAARKAAVHKLDVFEQVDPEGDFDLFRRIAQDVEVSARGDRQRASDAIDKATEGRTDEDKAGLFLTVESSDVTVTTIRFGLVRE